MQGGGQGGFLVAAFHGMVEWVKLAVRFGFVTIFSGICHTFEV